MSLRARLLAGMVILVAAGLAVAAFATYEEQRSFLLDRVDQQVESALVPLSFQLSLSDGSTGAGRGSAQLFSGRFRFGRRPSGLGPAAVLPPGTFGELLGPNGKVLRRRTFSYGETAVPAPTLPAHLPLTPRGGTPRLFTVHSRTGADLRYRAVALAVGADTAVVAVPLREVDQTLHRLVVVEALVGGGVIVALMLLGWLVIRVGLRPLERIGRVTSEIAAGDLSRRVSPSNQRTEVGRLGLALNAMLGQIEQAFGERQASEDRLRRFLSDASHELRTPLTSIRGYAELFRLGATSSAADTEKAMARIEEEATRMGILVEDLLALARLDEMPQRRRERLDLEPLARDAADDARAAARDREVTVSVAGEHVVSGDPSQLRAVLANLMRNALTHTPAGTPVELSLRGADGTVRLQVRDHGPGLPEGAQDSVFERFWRSESGRERGKAGAGLGLAIVAAIVAAHAGRVSACNAPDGGAVFTIELPAPAAP